MKVFISWSGERSEALAKALREWLPLVLHFVEPWLSQSDIQAGERWSLEVAKELETCNFGIICVTRDNLASPWILFEAGALAKSMQEGRVVPLLLDLDFKEISGPLAQFQAKKADQSGIQEIVSALNKSASTPVADGQLEKLLAALWEDLAKQILSIPKSGTPEKELRPQGEILEELVAGIRNVELRIRDTMEGDANPFNRQKSKYQEMILMDAMHMISDGPGDPVNILMLAGFIRDDAPWAYELALDAYRAIQTDDKRAALTAVKKFLKVFGILVRGPHASEMPISRKVLRMIEHEMLTWSTMHEENPLSAAVARSRQRSMPTEE